MNLNSMTVILDFLYCFASLFYLKIFIAFMIHDVYFIRAGYYERSPRPLLSRMRRIINNIPTTFSSACDDGSMHSEAERY